MTRGIAVLMFALAAQAQGVPRPNIVVVLADDMGFSDLGCYGSEIHTPNLDRLAAGGLRLTQFYNTPRCSPSRAALLTGLYPQEAGIGILIDDHGVPGYRGELNDHCVTMAEVLGGAGYRTAMVGKWHLSHMYFSPDKKQLDFESSQPFWDTKATWPMQRGFEDYYGTIHGCTSYFDPFSLVQNNTPIARDQPDFYYTDAIGDHAAREIEKYGHGGPFFLYVAFTAPHWPMQAPEADIAKYRRRYLAGWDQIREQRYRREVELGVVDRNWKLSPRDPRVPAWVDEPHKEWEANRMATYAAMIEHLDSGVGRIMSALRSQGIEDNTLVVFLSDNGACAEILRPEWFDIPLRTRDGRRVKGGNEDPEVFAGPEDVWQSYGIAWANVSTTPFRLYKHYVHEGGISSPFIAHWPAVIHQGGRLSDQIGHITDLMPTVLEIAGAKYPATFKAKAIAPLEGRSLLPIFRGNPRKPDAAIFWEHEGNRGVRLGQWKLVSRYPDRWELYNMTADRTELDDLARRYPEKVTELSGLYEGWAQRCRVLPPDRLPAEIKIAPSSHDG